MERFCANCGETLNSTDTVCPKCGTSAPVNQGGETNQQPAPEQSSSKPKGKATLGIASIVMGVGAWLVANMAPLVNINFLIIFTCVCAVVALVGAILGAVSIKNRKGLGIAGLLIGLFVAGFLGLAIIGYFGFKMAKDCVPTEDKDYVKCVIEIYGEEMEEELPKALVTDEQMRKETKEETKEETKATDDKDNVSSEDEDKPASEEDQDSSETETPSEGGTNAPADGITSTENSDTSTGTEPNA